MYNELKTSFLAKIENLPIARTITTLFLMDLEIPNAVVNELKTAISEAVTNAIVHGYENDESKSVYMNLSYDNYNIYAEVIDYGIGIPDIEQAQEPLYTTKKDEERSGLGFTIMNVFTDNLDVISRVNEGTKITMIKNYILYKS